MNYKNKRYTFQITQLKIVDNKRPINLDNAVNRSIFTSNAKLEFAR